MRLFLLLLFLGGLPAFATENLIENGGFEVPFVNGMVPQDKGGDPTIDKFKGWVNLGFQGNTKNGAIIVGLTNQVHRSGKQALFVQFNYVTAPYQSVFLTTNFMPVAPGTDYQVGIAGLIDPKNPMNADGRSVYLKLEIDYYAKDGNTSVGEPFYAVQPIPGSRNHPADFTTDKWYQFRLKVTTPPDAVFAQVTWRWETGGRPGEAGDNSGADASPAPGDDVTNGLMYFDDAFFFGPPAANPDLTPEPAKPADDNASPAASPDDSKSQQ